MNLSDYQEQVTRFVKYPNHLAVVYPAIGLSNEAGECLGKVKKVLRGDKSLEEQRSAILDECGDVLWYLTVLARACGASLEDVASINYTKLSRREANGTIKGDGDSR
jgi:NTP pyrophosphatase (non-canonical NTP hydrolase)